MCPVSGTPSYGDLQDGELNFGCSDRWPSQSCVITIRLTAQATKLRIGVFATMDTHSTVIDVAGKTLCECEGVVFHYDPPASDPTDGTFAAVDQLGLHPRLQSAVPK
jgi:hypothetical protein